MQPTLLLWPISDSCITYKLVSFFHFKRKKMQTRQPFWIWALATFLFMNSCPCLRSFLWKPTQWTLLSNHLGKRIVLNGLLSLPIHSLNHPTPCVEHTQSFSNNIIWSTLSMVLAQNSSLSIFDFFPFAKAHLYCLWKIGSSVQVWIPCVSDTENILSWLCFVVEMSEVKVQVKFYIFSCF